MSVSVCACAAVFVHYHISATTRPIFTIFVRVIYGRGSVLLWWRSDMLRISGYVDDVKFEHKLMGCSKSPPG